MKKFTTLILAAGLVLGASFSAQAATTFSANGFTDVSTEWVSGGSINKASSIDAFNASQFTMANFTFNSGDVKGLLSFQILGRWGQAGGFALGTDGINLTTKQAWIDFKIPGTDVSTRLGIQNFSLPQSLPGVGNPVLAAANVAAITVNAPINDMFSVTGFWARPIDLNTDSSNNTLKSRHDEFDLFGLTLPIKYENYFTATPWFMIGQLGKDALIGNSIGNPLRQTNIIAGSASKEFNNGMFNRSYTTGAPAIINQTTGAVITAAVPFTHADYPGVKMEANTNKQATPFWVGVPFAINYFDPFTFNMDIAYGSNGLNHSQKRAGWYTTARAAYKLAQFTPSITAWYTSGDDKNPFNGSEMMPSIFSKQGFTNYGFGSAIVTMGQNNTINPTVMGTWGVSLAASNISFIEKLTHTLRLSYYVGTNSNSAANVAAFKNAGGSYNTASVFVPGVGGYGTPAVYLTKKDSAFEFNFNNSYALYDQLQLNANFNMILPSISKTTWGQDTKTRSLYAITLGARYSF